MAQANTPKLSNVQRIQAINWYTNYGYALSTIAEHFELSVDDLKSQLNNVEH